MGDVRPLGGGPQRTGQQVAVAVADSNAVALVGEDGGVGLGEIAAVTAEG